MNLKSRKSKEKEQTKPSLFCQYFIELLKASKIREEIEIYILTSSEDIILLYAPDGIHIFYDNLKWKPGNTIRQFRSKKMPARSTQLGNIEFKLISKEIRCIPHVEQKFSISIFDTAKKEDEIKIIIEQIENYFSPINPSWSHELSVIKYHKETTEDKQVDNSSDCSFIEKLKLEDDDYKSTLSNTQVNWSITPSR